jgi:hypothetical protein
MKSARLLALIAAALAWAPAVHADDAGADLAGAEDAGQEAQTVTSARGAEPDAGQAAAAESIGGCVESVPKGMQRPVVREAFPQHGTSGWAAALRVTVVHGKGERVLPAGLDLSSATEAKKLLREHGFAIPEPDGGAGARLFTEPDDPSKPAATTHLELPLVLLPEKPGRQWMNLPPLPVAVARANGEIATVCTSPHRIIVDDPIASVPQAEPRPNPPPRPQREEWTALRKAVLWGGLGVLLGAILAFFAWRHLTRPKPPPPPPPPRPPWEVALEQLDEVRHAGLLDALRYGEYFDRVSDAVRGYLGARFGFDGLESTTDEILAALEKRGEGFVHRGRDDAGAFHGPRPGVPLDDVRSFLRECDLVKFANLTPTPEQCAAALSMGEQLVRGTMPGAGAPARGADDVSGGAPSAGGPDEPGGAAAPAATKNDPGGEGGRS